MSRQCSSCRLSLGKGPACQAENTPCKEINLLRCATLGTFERGDGRVCCDGFPEAREACCDWSDLTFRIVLRQKQLTHSVELLPTSSLGLGLTKNTCLGPGDFLTEQ